MNIESKSLNENLTAKYIGMSRSFLRQGRMNGDKQGRTPTPPYLKIGRSVRYLKSDLDTWLEQFRKGG
jgi:predicted DNA-binding transcriptional regulator AlpA